VSHAVIRAGGPQSAPQPQFDIAERLIQQALLQSLVEKFDPPRRRQMKQRLAYAGATQGIGLH
jgi:hypothetical protein